MPPLSLARKTVEIRRVRNHFYRPDTGGGLTDGPDFYGINSFGWATKRNGGGFIVGQSHSWQNARDYEYDSLANGSKVMREENLANLMYSLGHVIHLNQDLTQPDHARNDEHAAEKEKAVENYGLKYLDIANRTHAVDQMFPRTRKTWSWWRNNGFLKVRDFWDRDLYKGRIGDSTALVNDIVAPAKQLGLSEFVNGNFVTKDATYPQAFVAAGMSDREQHWFAYPSLESSTDFARLRRDFGASIHQVVLENGITGDAVYLDKLFDGILILPHSKLTHSGVNFRRFGGALRASATVDDDQVLNAYYQILMRKAVEYSTGLLDYFFRGEMQAATIPQANGTYKLTIQNVSGQDFKGGKFHLFYDVASGDRAELTGNDYTMVWNETSSALPDNGTVEATFKPPTGVAVERYTLVYKGSIGSDPVDNDIAVCACSIVLGGPQAWWAYEGRDVDHEPDSISGKLMERSVYDDDARDDLSKVAGKLGHGITGTYADYLFLSGGQMSYSGNGFSICGWIKMEWPEGESAQGDVGYSFGNGQSANIRVNNGEVYDQAWGVAMWDAASEQYIAVGCPAEFSSGDWQFFCVTYDPMDGKLRLRINANLTVVSALSMSAVTDADPQSGGYAGGWGDTEDVTVTWDEIGFFPQKLTETQINYLYNSGTGRTWPVTLP